MRATDYRPMFAKFDDSLRSRALGRIRPGAQLSALLQAGEYLVFHAGRLAWCRNADQLAKLEGVGRDGVSARRNIGLASVSRQAMKGKRDAGAIAAAV